MTSAFSRVRFVLTEPSHPGNVGSAARAVKNMGFRDLWLAAPQTPGMQQSPEAIALASGATDVLTEIQTAPDLSQALGPVTLAFALTARARDLGPPACDIREAAALACEHLKQSDNRVAMVFGCERAGLTNEQVALCQRVCHIPANPEYSSLNVSQALQLVAWEMRYALIDEDERLPSTPDVTPDPGKAPATGESIQALFDHWQEALIAVKFLDPAHPKKLVPRMQHLFQRSGLTRDEVDMLRGLCTAMIKTARQK
ncbi:MAG: RNA methyltransferase [Burkholderiaceae bacterium]|nr:RNA methyltransferase [Burkholderiaceae bacterium]MCD8516554.1 RNA methyltransferase [Burkholderiaceae bacterium]MCD8565223.1 RNA methyltransferase [Burkholderiaceae bacterium]